MTWSINEKMLAGLPPERQAEAFHFIQEKQAEYATLEAQQEKDRQARLLLKHPTLKTILAKVTAPSRENFKRAFLSKLDFARQVLSIPLPDDDPTMEQALAVLGRAQALQMLMADIQKLILCLGWAYCSDELLNRLVA